MYDVIIIGSGPAGISAALYTVRGGMRTLVLGSGASSLDKAEKIENYYGLPEAVPGAELYKTGVAQAGRLGAEIREEEVLGITYGEGFLVATAAGEYACKALIIAAGRARRSLPIEGLAALEGRGVSYCAVCDGFFYRGKRVAVLGESAYAAHEAEYLADLAGELYILTNGKSAGAAMPEKAEIHTAKLQKLTGDGKLEAAVLADGTVLPLDGLFVALGSASSADFATKLGVMMENGAILTDAKQATNVPGVFAAGDCAEGINQISVAVGQGAAAGMSAIAFVKGKA